MTATARWIGRLVGFCSRRAWLTAALLLLIAVSAGWYAATHFKMTSDTGELISDKLPWRQREIAYGKAFPQNGNSIVAVVDGQTPELAELGASKLTEAVSARPDLFPTVSRPEGGPFFQQNGLLFLSTAKVKDTTEQLIKAAPFMGALAADPSLRGVCTSLSTALLGVKNDQTKLADLERPLRAFNAAFTQVEQGKRVFFSWRSMISGEKPAHRELRQLVVIHPKLDFGRLEPGAAASDWIRAKAKALGLDAAHGMRVRLTGDIPLEDEEFGSLAHNAGLIGALMLVAILAMLWLAVRSKRIVACILVTTFAGLALAAAIGLIIFHRFNVISVAFIPLFVGLGVDFGIQFSVRYRAEQLDHDSISEALVAAGEGVGRSLVLAATAIAVGFLAFLPTDYRGVSELGAIAGLGMVLGLLLNLTLLPALLQLVRPSGRMTEVGYSRLEPVNEWLVTHRKQVIIAGFSAAAIGLALTPFARFDFNPLHLRSEKVESMATLNDLLKDPDQSPNTVDILAKNLPAANALASRLSRLPEVSDSITLSTFVPSDQPAKLALIQDASGLLDLTINPIMTDPAPTDAENVQALRGTAQDLRDAAAHDTGPGSADALRLAATLDRLAAARPIMRDRASAAILPGLDVLLDQMRTSLQAQPITMDTLPKEIVNDWITKDGRARISVLPRGDSNDNRVLRKFTDAVLKVAPTASGTPIAVQKAGDTVSAAFIEAAILSFIAITLLLFFVLRKVQDVVYTMMPIILTGLLTLGSTVIIGQPLNYANIIAFPLLFGIGVAFHIYFIMAWRSGGSHLLESSLARAVFFSAMTTATGFGSLWASSHPGTASMGMLLMISLIWTLVAALIFQPALMGEPRKEIAEV
jgi:hopanoid biosynthesis associated RND transporter like protein HpnN